MTTFCDRARPGAHAMRRGAAALRAALFLVLATLVLVSPPASAQETAAPEAAVPVLPDPLTPEAARALVAGLSDEDVRHLLLERLDAHIFHRC